MASTRPSSQQGTIELHGTDATGHHRCHLAVVVQPGQRQHDGQEKTERDQYGEVLDRRQAMTRTIASRGIWLAAASPSTAANWFVIRISSSTSVTASQVCPPRAAGSGSADWPCRPGCFSHAHIDSSTLRRNPDGGKPCDQTHLVVAAAGSQAHPLLALIAPGGDAARASPVSAATHEGSMKFTVNAPAPPGNAPPAPSWHLLDGILSDTAKALDEASGGLHHGRDPAIATSAARLARPCS